MTPITLLLQAAPDQNFGLRMMLNFALIIPIFYFLLIRPQMKERKRHEEMVKGVKKGDEVVTNGGLIGTVIHSDGHRLTVRTGESTRVTVDRGRVASVLEEEGHLNMRSQEYGVPDVHSRNRLHGRPRAPRSGRGCYCLR